jgi:hypothetical protein
VQPGEDPGGRQNLGVILAQPVDGGVERRVERRPRGPRIAAAGRATGVGGDRCELVGDGHLDMVLLRRRSRYPVRTLATLSGN